MARVDDVVINVEIKTPDLEKLLAFGDAVARLNRELSELAAKVDGRMTKEGWELEEGWKSDR